MFNKWKAFCFSIKSYILKKRSGCDDLEDDLLFHVFNLIRSQNIILSLLTCPRVVPNLRADVIFVKLTGNMSEYSSRSCFLNLTVVKSQWLRSIPSRDIIVHHDQKCHDVDSTCCVMSRWWRNRDSMSSCQWDECLHVPILTFVSLISVILAHNVYNIENNVKRTTKAYSIALNSIVLQFWMYVQSSVSAHFIIYVTEEAIGIDTVDPHAVFIPL